LADGFTSFEVTRSSRGLYVARQINDDSYGSVQIGDSAGESVLDI
jgi:hypothetical protein